MAQGKMLSSAVRRLSPRPPTYTGAPQKKLTIAAIHWGASFSGPFFLTGTVAISGSPDVPVKRLVLLIDRQSKKVARATWSDPVTGSYSFSGIKDGPWVVLTFDHTAEYNAVVADNIYGERM